MYLGKGIRRRIVSAFLIALLPSFVVAQRGKQGSDDNNEIVGTVSCPVCVPKGAQKLDLVCARTCLSKNPGSQPGNNANASAGSSANGLGNSASNSSPNTNSNAPSNNNSESIGSKSPDADFPSNAVANPAKNADTGVNLVIIEDGDYRSLVVDNPEKIKSHLAHRVAVTGYWVNKKFHVVSVRTL